MGRADKAASSAALALARCEEKKGHLQQLELEICAQQSNAVNEACNAPAQVSKRIDSLQLRSCSSPTERFAHQLDLIYGTQQVVDKLQRRINCLQKHSAHSDVSTCCGCNCIHCCELRAQQKQEMAQTLELAAKVAVKHCGGYRGHSVGAVKTQGDAKHPQSAKHLRALRESANLYDEDRTACASVKTRPVTASPVCLRQRMMQPSSSSQAQKAELASPELSTGKLRPRSASCASCTTRRRVSNEDF